MEFSLEKQEAICVPNFFPIGVGWKCIDHPLLVPYAIPGACTWRDVYWFKEHHKYLELGVLRKGILLSCLSKMWKCGKHCSELKPQCRPQMFSIRMLRIPNGSLWTSWKILHNCHSHNNLTQNCWTIMNSLFHFAKIKGQSFTPHFVVPGIAVDFWGSNTAK